MSRTRIEWATHVWNPLTGCSPVSEGCANCYARRMAKRLAGRCGYPAGDGFAVTLHPDRLDEPARWRKPRLVFVCSMGDLFHEQVPAEFIKRVFDVMAAADRHVFLVLTKRTKRLAAASRGSLRDSWPDHVWAGASVGVGFLDLHRAEVPHRFASYEPLISPPAWIEPVRGLDWVIIGGETGPGARPMEVPWAERLVADCQAAGVPVFVKQLGSWWAHTIGTRDKRGADPAEWPAALRVREWPAGLGGIIDDA